MLRYRLNPAPSRALPLNVRSAGHYRLTPGQTLVREPGRFLQVFWCISGAGHFEVRATSHAVRPGVVFLYAANEPHTLHAGAEGWEYRWLTFDGTRFPRIQRDYGLARVQAAGPCPAHLFDELDTDLRDPAADGEIRASVKAYEILLRATSPRTDTIRDAAQTSRAADAKAWLDTHFTDARLNVAALATRFHLHRATLHRVFNRHYGVPPVRYLARLRLRLALDLLAGPHLPVAEIAVRCGLPDISHFSKLISRHTGFSPRAYRQRHAHSDDTSAMTRS